jgi:hypothetical protein
MTGIVDVSSDWLALREEEDSRARSMELALSLGELLPDGPLVVHDLGSGTGSMMRWLAPLLPGPQEWVLHDWNARLTDRAIEDERPLDRDRRPVSVTRRVDDLAHLRASDLQGATLVTASALLDVLTAQELHAIVDASVGVGSPALFALSVTGDVSLTPGDPRDPVIQRAFNAHQRRVAGDRRLLGRYGAPIARGLFGLAGWRVQTRTTNWQLDAQQPRLLSEWLDGWIDAAVEQAPELREASEAYRDLRTAQLARGELSAVVRHLDLLAWPR